MGQRMTFHQHFSAMVFALAFLVGCTTTPDSPASDAATADVDVVDVRQSDSGAVDGGGSCNCCGTTVSIGPQEDCLTGVCDLYCLVRDAGSASDSSTSDGASDAGGLAVGQECASDGECARGLLCCYPCGIPGCHNRCGAPDPGTTRCPLLP